MQVLDRKFKQLIRSIAPSGNLFLLVTLPELRAQGLTYLAFYALQRIIKEKRLSEINLRMETGLEDYEVSRACRLLEKSGLITVHKSKNDARIRVLVPTLRAPRILDQVLLAAARRFRAGMPAAGRLRRLSEATESFRSANQMLLGPLQLTFFDADQFDKDPPKLTRATRNTEKLAGSRSKRSEP
jgi:DNA-binding MarR family transcriptional regulator